MTEFKIDQEISGEDYDLLPEGSQVRKSGYDTGWTKRTTGWTFDYSGHDSDINSAVNRHVKRLVTRVGWHLGEEKTPGTVTTARIDTLSREEVHRLINAIGAAQDLPDRRSIPSWEIDQMIEGLRAFANPKPPRCTSPHAFSNDNNSYRRCGLDEHGPDDAHKDGFGNSWSEAEAYGRVEGRHD